MYRRYGMVAVLRSGDTEITDELMRGIVSAHIQNERRKTRLPWLDRLKMRQSIGRGEMTAKDWQAMIFDAEMRYGEPLEDMPFMALTNRLLGIYAITSLLIVAIWHRLTGRASRPRYRK